MISNKLFLLATLLVLAAANDFAQFEIEDTLKQLKQLSAESNAGGSVTPKAGGESFKDYCTCSSHKECVCCADKDLQFPQSQETFKTKVCSTMNVDVQGKVLRVKIHVGTITILEKEVPFVSFDTYCKKLEKYPKIEFCSRMEVKESEAKGLTACVKINARIMGLIDHNFLLPCINFKEEKLSIDDSMEDYEAGGGIRVNLVALWRKFLKWLNLL